MSKLIVAISSRALFDLSFEHDIFLESGFETYREHQIKNENEILKPGVAFGFIQKLLAIKHPETDESMVEVVLVSRNTGEVGLRIFNSINHYNLDIKKGAFTCGASRYSYLKAYGVHLFLSSHNEDVITAIKNGIASAHLLCGGYHENESSPEVKIAFDGDAVLFSDESERVFQKGGLQEFQDNEAKFADVALCAGPFKGFLTALHEIQCLFGTNCPIRTALITARCSPAHERVIKTLRTWGVGIDEAMFLGGMEKTQFIEGFGADIFFDDQLTHVQKATNNNSLSGFVSCGVKNVQVA